MGDYTIILPNLNVESEPRKPVLYDHQDRPMYRPIGFAVQTRGTYPEISVPKPKVKPKGGKCGKK